MSDEMSRIDAALDALIRAAINDDAKAVTPSAGRLTATPFNIASFDHVPTEADVQFAFLLSNPVGAACRHGVRAIGKRLFKIVGSVDGMREVAERVADMDPTKWGYRATIMDHAWNGIGEGDNRWWS